MIPDLAIGAVLASIITSLITLTGLLIAKESKTSEFRQQWIDSLRNEISQLIGHTQTIVHYSNTRVGVPQHEGAFDEAMLHTMKDEILESERLYHKILLRLNPEKHVGLISAVDSLRKIINKNLSPETDIFHLAQQKVLKECQDVLKNEWKRVKNGEPIFRLAKMIALVFVVGSISYKYFS